MTVLNKPLKREVAVHHTRPVVIEIDPERQVIGFREKGCKKTFYLHIMTAFALAVRAAKEEK